jgi:hypothetical protein
MRIVKWLWIIVRLFMKVYRRTPRRHEGCHHWITQRGQDLPANIFDSGESGHLRGVYRRSTREIRLGEVCGTVSHRPYDRRSILQEAIKSGGPPSAEEEGCRRDGCGGRWFLVYWFIIYIIPIIRRYNMIEKKRNPNHFRTRVCTNGFSSSLRAH